MQPGQRAFDVRVEAESRINTPADVVYQLIADYTTHHPAFLPSAFSNLVVETGGVGEGTIIVFDTKLGGRTRRSRARISEPRSGVLQETIIDDGTTTTFEVTEDSDASRVRIQTEFTSANGLQGWFERRFAPGMLRRLYREELTNLDNYAKQVTSSRVNPQEPSPALG